MFKAITIGGKEYHLEYTVEAALYGDATQKLMDFIIQTATASSSGDADRAAIIKENLRAVSDVPQTAMTLFYAGLLEHHGTFGDGTVKSLADAKRLVAQYFRDHAEDGTGNFMDILTMCLDQMGEDGFFKTIGLEKMFAQTEADEKAAPEPAKISAARKKKATEK
jgi:hypothetical protein